LVECKKKKIPFHWRCTKTNPEQISRKGVHKEYLIYIYVWSNITFGAEVLSAITGCLLNKLIHNSKGFVKGRGIIELNSILFPRILSLHRDLQGDAPSIYTITHTHTQDLVRIHKCSRIYTFSINEMPQENRRAMGQSLLLLGFEIKSQKQYRPFTVCNRVLGKLYLEKGRLWTLYPQVKKGESVAKW